MGLFFRRSQAALEFLTTYGWAVLVLLVMVASLSNFGILSPDRFLPERCSVGGGFSCDGFEVFEGGLVRVLLVSELGRDLVGGDVSGGVVEGRVLVWMRALCVIFLMFLVLRLGVAL